MEPFSFREWDTEAFLELQKVKNQIVFIHRNRYLALEDAILANVNSEETARASRFFHSKDREVYLLGKYVLRKILAAQTGLALQKIIFSKTHTHKPFFEGQAFNLSHSGDHIYLAFSPFEVGIDAEKNNLDFDLQPVVDACFSGEESAMLSTEEYRHHFYTIWTRKEALLKATGEGLCDDMKQVPAIPSQVRRNGQLYFLTTRRHEDYIVSYATSHTDPEVIGWEFA
jgi:4'-phosphopantetheinyl transferase